MRVIFFATVFLFMSACSNLNKKSDFKMSEDLLVTKINERSFNIKDTSFYNSNVFVSKMPNGTVVIASSFIDSVRTELMMSWIKKELVPQKIVAINTHFHADGTGGNEGFTNHNVEIWSTEETNSLYRKRAKSMQTDLAKFVNNDRLRKYVLDRKNLPAQNLFEANTGKKWKFGNEEVIAYYPGPGHTSDNIIVYFPHQKILFGGCLLRALSWKSLGNTDDANLNLYYNSVKKLLKFDADTVIPGHGDIGTKALIHHTMDIAKRTKDAQ